VLFQTLLTGAAIAKNIAATPSPTKASRSAYSTKSCARWQITNLRHPRVCLRMIFILVGTVAVGPSSEDLSIPSGPRRFYQIGSIMPGFAFYNVKVPLIWRMVGVESSCPYRPMRPFRSIFRLNP